MASKVKTLMQQFVLPLKQVVEAMKRLYDLVKPYYCLDWACPHPLLSLEVSSWAVLDHGSHRARRSDSLSWIKPSNITAQPALAPCPAYRDHCWPWSACWPTDTLLTFIYHSWQVSGTARDGLVKWKVGEGKAGKQTQLDWDWERGNSLIRS